MRWGTKWLVERNSDRNLGDGRAGVLGKKCWSRDGEAAVMAEGD
jgi:hypothetical protein